jgi:tetratricopeptide (TPR) repeat protein
MAAGATWQEKWKAATAARDGGEVARALALYDGLFQGHPPASEPYYEAGDFFFSLICRLAGVRRLYRDHCAAYSVPPPQPATLTTKLPVADVFLEYGQRLPVIEAYLGADSQAPHRPQQQRRLAEICGYLGDQQQALDWQQRAANVSAHEDDLLAVGRILEERGSSAAALAQYREVLSRWPDNPEALLRSISIRYASGDTTAAEELFEALGRIVHAEDSAFCRADVLCAVAWKAVGVPGLSATPVWSKIERWIRTTARLAPSYFPAKLAEGFINLPIAPDAARDALALASYLASLPEVIVENERIALNETVWNALSAARIFLSRGVLPFSSANDTVNENRLRSAHVRSLSAGGKVMDALMEAGAVAAANLPASIPQSYEIHHGYKIVLDSGRYYAVPKNVSEFRIVRGTVYRIPPGAHTARLRVPRVFVRSARRILAALRPLGGRVYRAARPLLGELRPLRRLAHRAINLILSAYVVPGVMSAESRAAILELAEGSLHSIADTTGRTDIPDNPSFYNR